MFNQIDQSIVTSPNRRFIPIVLCAGFGTRLQPLSFLIPKVVVPLGQYPIAFYSIKNLLDMGFETVHCNVHYLAQSVKDEINTALRRTGYSSDRVRFWDESPDILDSGGGIARIAQELIQTNQNLTGYDILVVSGDIYSPFPWEQAISLWQQRPKDAEALMVTLPMTEERNDITWVKRVLQKQNANEFEKVVGFGKAFDTSKNSASVYEKRLFSNHQIISGDLVKKTPLQKISSVKLFYWEIINKGNTILHMNFPDKIPWFNIGSYEEYNLCIEKLIRDSVITTSDFPKTVFQLNQQKDLTFVLKSTKFPKLKNAYSSTIWSSLSLPDQGQYSGGYTLDQAIQSCLSKCLVDKSLKDHSDKPDQSELIINESSLIFRIVSHSISKKYLPLLICVEDFIYPKKDPEKNQVNKTLFLLE